MGGRALRDKLISGRDERLGRRSLIALALGGLALAMSATVVVLHAANSDLEFRDDYLGYSLTVAAGSVLYAALGAIILWRQPRQPIGALLLGIGLAAGFAALCREYAVLGADADGLLPGASWAWWMGSFVWYPGYAIRVTLLLVIFPTGRPVSRAWWSVAIAAIILIVADTVWFALTPFESDLPTELSTLTHPLGVTGEPRAFEDAFTPLPLIYLAVTLACLAALANRLTRSTGLERKQVGWFAIGATLWVAAAIVDATTNFSERWEWAELLFIALPALGATIGIVYYDLYDIRRVVHRGSVILAFSAVAAGLYAGVLLLGEYWFGRPSNDVWTSSMAVGLIAAVALPALRSMDRAARRLLYGDAADPLIVLSRLTDELAAAGEPAAALSRAPAVVASSLRVPFVRVDADGVGSSEAGQPGGDVESFPLLDQGVPVGTLVIGRRAPGESFAVDERRLFADLAVRLGAAASSVRHARDLAAAREQLVLGREEERRRIRHDLHDGLGPQLAGIGLQLDLGRELIERDPGRVAALLARAKDEIDAALVGVRHLVDGLRPPALDELGLVDAIRQQVSLLDARVTDGYTVTVTGDQLAELPAALEVAAYRIAIEAANNASRHGRARCCSISIHQDDVLEVIVDDDGQGFDHDARAGVGLTSMRHRAEELGGTLIIESSPNRGTRLVARLPVP